MSHSSLTHSIDTHRLSMVSKPSLLNQMNMECEFLNRDSENKRTILTEEVNDMEHRPGIFPKPHIPLELTTSLTEYPMETNLQKEQAIEEEDQAATMIQMMDTMSEDDQTRSRESLNLKCHGSARNSVLERTARTLAATKQGISSTYSKEIQPLSKNGLSVHRAPQPDPQAQNGTHSSKEKQLISIPSSVLCTTSTALTKSSDVLGLLRSSLEDQSQRQRLKQVASGPPHSTRS